MNFFLHIQYIAGLAVLTGCAYLFGILLFGGEPQEVLSWIGLWTTIIGYAIAFSRHVQHEAVKWLLAGSFGLSLLVLSALSLQGFVIFGVVLFAMSISIGDRVRYVTRGRLPSVRTAQAYCFALLLGGTSTVLMLTYWGGEPRYYLLAMALVSFGTAAWIAKGADHGSIRT